MATERDCLREAKDPRVPVVSPNMSWWAGWDLTNEVGNKATQSHIPTGRIFSQQTKTRQHTAICQPRAVLKNSNLWKSGAEQW